MTNKKQLNELLKDMQTYFDNAARDPMRVPNTHEVCEKMAEFFARWLDCRND